MKKEDNTKIRIKSVIYGFVSSQESINDRRLRPSFRSKLISSFLTPQNVSFYKEFKNGAEVLSRESTNIPGNDLTHVDYSNPLLLSSLESLETRLKNYHDLGLVHGDIRAKNIIFDGKDCHLIDWEGFCLQSINGNYRSIGYQKPYKHLKNPSYDDLCEADLKSFEIIKNRITKKAAEAA